MQNKAINADSAPAPSGGYSQAFEVQGAKRFLFISGQVPESRIGSVPETFSEQATLVWENVFAQLSAAGMSAANLVKVTTFLSSREYEVANRQARQQALGSCAPALTVIITGIFDERWMLEIEAIAAE